MVHYQLVMAMFQVVNANLSIGWRRLQDNSQIEIVVRNTFFHTGPEKIGVYGTRQKIAGFPKQVRSYTSVVDMDIYTKEYVHCT